MPSVRLERLAFAFAAHQPVVTGATAHLGPGWTGLVGPNGAGKSTLLRLLAGELVPDGGRVVRDPAHAVTAYCPQTVDAPPAAEVPGRWRALLGLDPAMLARWDTLSPGERRRWQVGAALGAEPDLLLLDEPTDHLDADARDLLVGALRRFRGIGVLVSHDRALLDALTTTTLHLERGELTTWRGGWSAAQEARTQARAAAVEARAAAVAQADHLAARLADARRERAGAQRQRNAGRRMKDRHDSDAREAGANYRAARAERGLGRAVERLRRAHAGAEAEADALAVARERGRGIFVRYEPAPTRVLAVAPPALALGPARMLDTGDVTLTRDTRVRLEGPNGAGKTTLLTALAAALRIPRERVLWLPQALDAAAARAVLDEVRALPAEPRGRVLELVAALGVDPDRVLASASPSPGEARKLALALGLGRHAWAVLLDEPTNHLDLPAVERLEEALGAYPGALVVVSHDPGFARAAVRERWVIADGRVRVTGA